MNRDSRIHPLTAALVLALLGAAAVQAGSKTVCVAPFSDNTGDQTWSGMPHGVSDLVATLIADDDNVEVVERDQLEAVLREHELSLAMGDTKTAVKVGRLVGADSIVVGGVMVMNNTLVASGRALDVATGTVVHAHTAKGPPDKLLALATELAAELGRGLGLKDVRRPETPGEVERKPMASAHFMRGMGLYHAGDANRGAMELMLCLDLAPGHTTARFWLANCYYRTRDWAHAAVEYDKFLKQFPQSPQAKKARDLLADCRDRVKAKETAE